MVIQTQNSHHSCCSCQWKVQNTSYLHKHFNRDVIEIWLFGSELTKIGHILRNQNSSMWNGLPYKSSHINSISYSEPVLYLAGVAIYSTVILKVEKMVIRNMVWINHLQFTLWLWIWSIFSSIQSTGYSWIGFEMFWQFKISCTYWHFHCNDLLWTLSIRKNSVGL